jgi:hypothetical protein
LAWFDAQNIAVWNYILGLTPRVGIRRLRKKLVLVNEKFRDIESLDGVCVVMRLLYCGI